MRLLNALRGRLSGSPSTLRLEGGPLDTAEARQDEPRTSAKRKASFAESVERQGSAGSWTSSASDGCINTPRSDADGAEGGEGDTPPQPRRPGRLSTWAMKASQSSGNLDYQSEIQSQYLPMNESHQKRHPWRFRVIDPERSEWLRKWDMVDGTQLVAIALVWPYETAFLEPAIDGLFFLNRVADLILMIDMGLQCFIAYPDPRRPQRLVKAPALIVRHYLTGWFWADLISFIPVDMVYVILSANPAFKVSSQESIMLRCIRLLRMLRIIRLVRFVKLVQRWHTSFGFSYAKLTMLKLFGILVLCCHWFACLWGGMAIEPLDEERNWLKALCDSKADGDGVFVPSNLKVWEVYSLALYWAIITITSIGYGDLTPYTLREYYVATFCSCIMASVWAYAIGAICGIVSTLNEHEVSFKRTMDDLNWFMDDRAMPHEMRCRLRRYFFEAKEMNKQRVEHGVMSQMSPLLQGECAMFMHSRWICKVWYLRDMNREIIIWAARCLTMCVFAPNEEVLGERTLFIVQHGVCAFKGRILLSGDIWGEDMLLSNDMLREKSKARAMSHLACATLHVVDLVDGVIMFDEARARLRWAQIQIAACRGIMLLAKKLQEWERRTGRVKWELKDEDRAGLYRAILHGEDEPMLSEECFIDDRARARRPSVQSAVSHNNNLAHNSEPPRSLVSLSTRCLQEGASTLFADHTGTGHSNAGGGHANAGRSAEPSTLELVSQPTLADISGSLNSLAGQLQDIRALMSRGNASAGSSTSLFITPMTPQSMLTPHLERVAPTRTGSKQEVLHQHPLDLPWMRRCPADSVDLGCNTNPGWLRRLRHKMHHSVNLNSPRRGTSIWRSGGSRLHG